MKGPAHRRPSRPRLLAACTAWLPAAVCIGCFYAFNPVVGEKMEIVFHPDAIAEVTLVATLRVIDPNDVEASPAVDERLRDVRDSIARRQDS